jgi:hypothetical protein
MLHSKILVGKTEAKTLGRSTPRWECTIAIGLKERGLVIAMI